MNVQRLVLSQDYYVSIPPSLERVVYTFGYLHAFLGILGRAEARKSK